MSRCKKQMGFTLIELVLVVLILGIVSVGVTNFLSTTTQIFVDITQRDRIMSDSRFVVERLNRELRYALPNSTRVTSGGSNSVHCLEFVPIEWSTFYLDIPTTEEAAANTIATAALVSAQSGNSYDDSEVTSHSVVVYPTSSDNVYANTQTIRVGLDAVDIGTVVAGVDTTATLTLDSSTRFASDSPMSRLYIVNQPVSYCVTAATGEITRHDNYGFLATQSVAIGGTLGDGDLMGEFLINSLSSDPTDESQNDDDPFRVAESTLTRNAVAKILLRFENEGERIMFNNEVHLQNVP